MTAEAIEFDRSLLGVEHRVGTFNITREAILAFCEAVGDSNPLFTDREAARAAGHDDIIAPPTFCTAFNPRMGFPDLKLEFPGVNLLAGQAVESLAPIKPGDTLTATTVLKEVYSKTGRSGTMVFWTWETRYTNQDGVIAAKSQQSFVRRGRGVE